MKLKRRQWLFAAFAATLIIVVLTAKNDLNNESQVVQPTSGIALNQLSLSESGVTSESKSPVDAATRDPIVDSKLDPFRPVSFLPQQKAAPPPPTLAPPKPSAPTFPYKYFGRMIDIDGKSLTYLQRGETLTPIQDQQILDGNYQITSISDTQITVTYLPLSESTVIHIQSAEKQAY